MNQDRSRRICVVSLHEPKQTFVLAHVNHLPAETTLLWGRNPLAMGSQGKPASLPTRGARWLRRKLLREQVQGPTTRNYIRAFSRFRPDAVVAEFGVTGVVVQPACRQLEIPLITYFHGYDASRHAILTAYGERYRRLFETCARIIAVSRPMEERLVEMGARRSSLVYNPSGVDCELFAGARPEQAPPILLFVGRFVEKKAPYLTLLAFWEVRKTRPEARLRMVGDGPLFGPCRDLAKALGIDDAVAFLGSQSHEVVRDEMLGARGYVQHSVEARDGDCEGTPVAILEAGASGLPVVSTRHAGIPEVVGDGQTGFLVEERDVAKMADCMGRLIDDPKLAGRMGRAARARIQQDFSMEKSIGRLWSCIEDAIRDCAPSVERRRESPQVKGQALCTSR